ncbi:ABC transporter permease [Granulicella sibirica]|uniref:Hydroxymethylpyrimidine ABC transporter, transmembrane component n=1 Tax=Granulicella sibirica TaxID=2479048 RepID=A0A4Q0T700_9BACT|nr:ABC transporter permease subunit [Granulicella sibirica]RXH57819.1 Hydroxymethylpyrimidine ABC transporter, transmembrane component [Granulicella sibirica]
MKRTGTALASALGLFAALLLLWLAVIRIFAIQTYILPTPLQVAKAGAERFPSLLTSLSITAEAAAGGLLAAILVGVLVSLLFAQSRWVRRMFYPYTILLQTVPIIAIAPLIIMWVGHSVFSVGLIAFIICLAPIIANTTQGLISVDRNMVDLFLMSKASRAQILLKLRLPHAMPSLFSGIRISSGIAVIGALTGELFAGSARVGVGGIGYAIQYASSQLETDYLFALVAAATFLGFTFFFTVMFLEWYFLHQWHESARTADAE